MNTQKYIINILLLSNLANIVSAQEFVINDFDGYADTAALQDEWSFFGAASGGAPELPIGTGINGSNSARFALVWSDGNNANMNYTPFPVPDLSIYDSLDVLVYLETINGFSSPTNPTTLVLAIEGGTSNTIWQTNSAFAATPNIGSYTQLSFNLSESEMINVSAETDSFSDVLSDVSGIRLRFENTQEADVQQFAFIDNLTAVPEPSSYALPFGLSVLGFTFYRRSKKARS